ESVRKLAEKHCVLGRVVDVVRVVVLVRVAESAANLDCRQFAAYVVASCPCPSHLEIHLCALSVVDLHVAELHGCRIIGFGKTRWCELRSVNAFRGRGIELAIAGAECTVESRRSWKRIFVIRPRAGDIPGKPRRRQGVCSAYQQTANSDIGPAVLRVETWEG